MVSKLRPATARLWLCALTLFLIGQIRHNSLAQGTLTLSQPTYDCSTGAITFNTSGGNGSTITYSAAGIIRNNVSSSTGTVEAGLRGDPKPITITATQGGSSTSYVFDLASFCATPSNRAPVYNGSIGVSTGIVGRTFYYYIPTGAFTDPDGQTLTYSATGLPVGFLIDPPTGTVYGTVSTTGISTITITATDPGGLSTSGRLTVGFNPEGGNLGGFALTQPTYNCTTGAITFTNTGGNGSPITYTVPGVIRSSPTSSTGTVEAGLLTDRKPLLITATQGGSISVYTFDLATFCSTSGTSGTGTSGNQSFSGTLGSTTGTVGQAFSYTLPTGRLTSGTGATISTGQTFTYTATGLPSGLSINAGTGAITGTPTTAGSSTVLITSLSSGSSTSSTSGTGTSTTGTNGTGTSGTATSGTGTSGTGTSGTGVSGIGQSFSGTLGIVISSSVTSGTSTTGTSGTGTGGTGVVFSGSLVSATGTVGQTFSYTLPTSAFTGATGQTLTYGATGLPPGLSVNSGTGAITGTPTTAGSNTVIITATSSGSSGTSGTSTSGQSASGTLGIVISSSVTSGTSTTGTSGTGTGGTGVVFSGTLLSATITAGQGFSYTLPTGAFTGPTGQTLTYSATGLPTGLTINSATGAISGTPTTAGSNTVVIRAASSTATSGSSTTGTSGTSTSGSSTVGTSASATLGLTVISSTVTSGTSTTGISGTGTSGTATTGVAFSGSLVSATGVVGRAFSYTLPTGTFTGPTGQSLTYSATSLPAGLSVNAATGAISGTPTTAGSNTVVITATSSGSSTTASSGTSTTGTSGTGTSATSTVGQSASGAVTITISASASGGRIATEFNTQPITIVAIGGNPIVNGVVEVAVTGATGEGLQVLLTDTQGRVIGQQSRERASTEERFRFHVGSQSYGTLLLRAATPTRANAIRLIKVD